MRRFLRFREGDPYSSTELLRTQFALDDSLYFSSVEVAPGEPGRRTTLTVPVSITADQGAPAAFAVAVAMAPTPRSAARWAGPTRASTIAATGCASSSRRSQITQQRSMRATTSPSAIRRCEKLLAARP